MTSSRVAGEDVTGLLPITELLLACETDAARAEWLLTVPEGVIHRDHVAIGKILVSAGFDLGHVYLSTLIMKIHARRMPDGRHPEAMLRLAERAALRMVAACVPQPGEERP